MAGLKLSKLPDRTPVKISITLLPDLYRDLQRYADLYRAQFGQEEPVTELVPYMLAEFLGNDRAFTKAGKAGNVDSTMEAHSRQEGRKSLSSETSTKSSDTL
jgi:hypothetical protein